VSPALVQALQRLVVIAVVGALTAVGINLTVLDGALPNAALLIPVITAVISAVLKYLGGPTIQVANAATSRAGAGIDKPPFWSV
jgi:hypothetical protein